MPAGNRQNKQFTLWLILLKDIGEKTTKTKYMSHNSSILYNAAHNVIYTRND